MVQTFTLPQFQAYMNKLPQELQKASSDINREMAMSLTRRIKLRAPSGSTGSLKRDINWKLNGKDIQITGPGHWSFVNRGVSPGSIPIELFEMHQSNPGSTAGKKIWIDKPKAFVNATYRGGKGFVDNAFISADKDFLAIIERGLNKAFQK